MILHENHFCQSLLSGFTFKPTSIFYIQPMTLTSESCLSVIRSDEDHRLAEGGNWKVLQVRGDFNLTLTDFSCFCIGNRIHVQ